MPPARQTAQREDVPSVNVKTRLHVGAPDCSVSGCLCSFSQRRTVMAQECNKQAEAEKTEIQNTYFPSSSTLMCTDAEKNLKTAPITTAWSIVSDRNGFLNQHFDKCGLVPFCSI